MERDAIRNLRILASLAAVWAAVSACAQAAPQPQNATSASGGLTGTWTAGCTTGAGIADIDPPSSRSYTSSIEANSTTLTYFVQGYSDTACSQLSNSVTYTFSYTVGSADSTYTAATDMSMSETSATVCAPTCTDNGGEGTLYEGIFLIAGNTLNINFAAGMLPTTLGYVFTE